MPGFQRRTIRGEFEQLIAIGLADEFGIIGAAVGPRRSPVPEMVVADLDRVGIRLLVWIPP